MFQQPQQAVSATGSRTSCGVCANRSAQGLQSSSRSRRSSGRAGGRRSRLPSRRATRSASASRSAWRRRWTRTESGTPPPVKSTNEDNVYDALTAIARNREKVLRRTNTCVARGTAAESRSLRKFLKKDVVNAKTGEVLDGTKLRAMIDDEKLDAFKDLMGYYQIH